MRLDDGVYAALAGSCVELFPEFAREDLKDYWMECIKAWNVNDEAAEGYYQMLTGMVMGAEGSIVDTHRRCCLKGKRRQRRADPPPGSLHGPVAPAFGSGATAMRKRCVAIILFSKRNTSSKV